jgi:alpha-tubulin suppressor-like RCC1 family protein
VQVAAGYAHTVGLKADGTVVAVGHNDYGQCNVSEWTDIVQVAAGGFHTVGLKSDGTVVALGNSAHGQCNTGAWSDIIHVAAGGTHTVGLRGDGNVLVVGDKYYGQCDVGDWSDVAGVVGGGYHTVGLMGSRRVMATGYNDWGQCNVGFWRGIEPDRCGRLSYGGAGHRGQPGGSGRRLLRTVPGGELDGHCRALGRWCTHSGTQGRRHRTGNGTERSGAMQCWQLDRYHTVAAGGFHTVGLRSDGTVVAVGDSERGQCNVGNWTGIVQVSAGTFHTVGLTAGGGVVAVGANDHGQCEVGGWTGIVQVAAGGFHTVGLKLDGTVVGAGRNDYGQRNVRTWTGIAQLASGSFHTAGLRDDGTVLAAGPEIELAKWDLGVVEYTLGISSGAGGSVAAPDEGVLTYNAGMAVRLIAEPEQGFRFAGWSGDVNMIANVNAATTLIVMQGDYQITANFEEVRPVNWPLVGGLIAAAVAAVTVLLLRRRKSGRAAGPGAGWFRAPRRTGREKATPKKN